MLYGKETEMTESAATARALSFAAAQFAGSIVAPIETTPYGNNWLVSVEIQIFKEGVKQGTTMGVVLISPGRGREWCYGRPILRPPPAQVVQGFL